jgi:hypothetical protein
MHNHFTQKMRTKDEAVLMRFNDYLEQFEYIIELDVLGKLTDSEKERRFAELLENVCKILDSPLHLQLLKPEEEESLRLIRLKIIQASH